jgi:hypothetical protein
MNNGNSTMNESRHEPRRSFNFEIRVKAHCAARAGTQRPRLPQEYALADREGRKPRPRQTVIC